MLSKSAVPRLALRRAKPLLTPATSDGNGKSAPFAGGAHNRPNGMSDEEDEDTGRARARGAARGAPAAGRAGELQPGADRHHHRLVGRADRAAAPGPLRRRGRSDAPVLVRIARQDAHHRGPDPEMEG